MEIAVLRPSASGLHGHGLLQQFIAIQARRLGLRHRRERHRRSEFGVQFDGLGPLPPSPLVPVPVPVPGRVPVDWQGLMQQFAAIQRLRVGFWHPPVRAQERQRLLKFGLHVVEPVPVPVLFPLKSLHPGQLQCSAVIPQ